MLFYILKRLAWVIPTMLAVLFLLFSLTYLLPGEPADIILGPRASEEMAEELREELGLDRPWYESYVLYLGQILRGDLGTSVQRQGSVTNIVLQVLPHTLILTFCGMGLAVINGLIIGLLAASNSGSWLDRFLTLLSFITASTPTYVAAVLLLLFFSVRWNLLPAMGVGGEGILNYIHHLIGPSLALSVAWTGYIGRLTRSSMLETLSSDYIETEKSFGLPRSYIIYKYALKNAIKPIVAVIGLGIGRLLGGALFVEIIFSRPGLGRLIVNGVYERDLPLIRGGVLIAALLFIMANLLADVSYAFFDPRIKQE